MKISLITVCYNSISTIEKTIVSVLRQRYGDIEYIIVDGGSYDGTVETIKKYQNNIACWISEPDEGIYDAMNKGLRCATGDIVAFINSDDYYVNDDIIGRIVSYFADETIDVVAGRINCRINERMLPEKKMSCEEEDIHVQMIYFHPAMFVRREIYEKIGMFNTKYRIAADYEWTLRAHNAGISFKQVPDICVNFSMNGISMTETYHAYLESREIALNGMKNHDINVLQKKIMLFYDEAIEKKKYDYYYRKIWRNEKQYILTQIDLNADYYIWGAGYFGQVALETFTELGLHIIGFIDNNFAQKNVCEYKVFTPSEIDKSCKICIATLKYEDEIRRQILDMKIDSKQFFCFSLLQKHVYEYAKQKYKFFDI